jgi:hypothetical protein
MLFKKGLRAVDDLDGEFRLDEAIFDWNDLVRPFGVKTGDETTAGV